MFNEDQQAYIRWLATLAPAEKCWCGWYRLGQCEAWCPQGSSAADKLAQRCQVCHATPLRHDWPVYHRDTCPQAQSWHSYQAAVYARTGLPAWKPVDAVQAVREES